MGRLIFIIVIFALVYWLLKSYNRQQPPKDNPAGAQDMVGCDHCGVNLPKGEAVTRDGKYYCCTAHSLGHEDK